MRIQHLSKELKEAREEGGGDDPGRDGYLEKVIPKRRAESTKQQRQRIPTVPRRRQEEQ